MRQNFIERVLDNHHQQLINRQATAIPAQLIRLACILPAAAVVCATLALAVVLVLVLTLVVEAGAIAEEVSTTCTEDDVETDSDEVVVEVIATLVVDATVAVVEGFERELRTLVVVCTSSLVVGVDSGADVDDEASPAIIAPVLWAARTTPFATVLAGPPRKLLLS